MKGQLTHLDTDVLAEFRAGLITGRRGARIAAHLAGCDRCTAVSDELTGVSALLAAVPVPAMPDQVARQLDTVLAAAAAQRNDSERARGDSPRDRATSGRPAGNRGFRLVSLRVLAPAAAVVLAAAGYGLSQLAGGPASPAMSPAAAGTAAKSASRANVNAPALAPRAAASAGSERMGPVSFPFVISSTNFLPGTLKQQLEAALRGQAAAGTTQSAPASVRACVSNVAGSADPVLAESAYYRGQPATVIVVSTSKGDTAWIAGAGCSAGRLQPLATVTLPPGMGGP
jgi:hypothetical protein